MIYIVSDNYLVFDFVRSNQQYMLYSYLIETNRIYNIYYPHNTN
jgi:hypothetical protein